MSGIDGKVIFTGSRAKLLPMAILMPVFLILFAIPLTAFVSIGLEDGWDDKIAVICAFFGVIFLLFLYVESILMRRIVRPNSLIVSREGLSIIKLGKSNSYLWSQLGEPTKKYVSLGKGGSFFVELYQKSGKPLLIPGETYIESFDDVFETLQMAKAGRDLTQPTKSNLKPFTRFVIPLALVATFLFYGTVARFAWVITHLHH